MKGGITRYGLAQRTQASASRMLRRRVAISALLSVVVAAAAPLGVSGSSAHISAGTILVGSIAGTTGADGTTGEAMVDGARLAIADVNARGGALGRAFALESYDDQASATFSSQLYAKLVSHGAVAVLGSDDTGQATAAMAQRLKIPDIGAVDDAGLTIYPNGPSQPPLDYVWSSGPNAFAWGASAAHYAQRHCTALAILHDPSSYGLGGEAAIKLAYSGSPRKIVLDDAVSGHWSTGATVGLSKEIDKLERAGADCVVAWLTPQDTARFMRTLATRGVKLTVIGNDEINADATFSRLAKRAGDGAIGAQLASWMKPNAQMMSFRKRYKAQFHVDATPFAVAGYDAVMLLAAVIEKAGSTDPAKLKDGFDSVTSFAGLQGTVSFSKQNHATVTERLLTPVRYNAAEDTWLATK
jgi:branched-chain amino acid transport system substrate-binding protein